MGDLGTVRIPSFRDKEVITYITKVALARGILVISYVSKIPVDSPYHTFRVFMVDKLAN